MNQPPSGTSQTPKMTEAGPCGPALCCRRWFVDRYRPASSRGRHHRCLSTFSPSPAVAGAILCACPRSRFVSRSSSVPVHVVCVPDHVLRACPLFADAAFTLRVLVMPLRGLAGMIHQAELRRSTSSSFHTHRSTSLGVVLERNRQSRPMIFPHQNSE